MAKPIQITMNNTKFEELHIENVWKIVRKYLINVKYLEKTECPVAFITNRNYFDIYNVFFEDKVSNVTTYQYLHKLQNIVAFPDKKYKDVKYFTQVFKNRTLERNQDFRMQLNSGKPSGIMSHFKSHIHKIIKVHITGLNKFSVIPYWTKRTSPSINPGSILMTTDNKPIDKVTIISEVVVVDKVNLAASYTFPDGKTERNEWTFGGPVIIAFGATDLELSLLGKDGKVINEVPVPRERLLSRSNWVYVERSNQVADCSIIDAVSQGVPYDLSSFTAMENTDRPQAQYTAPQGQPADWKDHQQKTIREGHRYTI